MPSGKKIKKIAVVILASGVLLALGFFVGFKWGVFNEHQSTSIQELRENMFNKKYTYINPLLGCRVVNKKAKVEFARLESKLKELVEQKIKAGAAQAISIYFDTRDGQWLGVNTSEKYLPSSMMKVPILMAYLKLSETSPAIMKKKVLIKKGEDLNGGEYFKPEHAMAPDRMYTIAELLERLVGYSDNNAIFPLLENFDRSLLDQMYRDLGFVLPSDVSGDFMDVRTYVNLFRVLYNATYLSRDSSEEALRLLALHHFPQGIESALPPGVLIAQKFGEATFFTSSTPQNTPQRELHDCGVVYFPDHPYLLCLMTKGTDFAALESSINAISGIIYDFMSRQYQVN